MVEPSAHNARLKKVPGCKIVTAASPQSFQKFDWIFRHSSLFLTIPMAQKPKSSGKLNKAAKPAAAKTKAETKPKTAHTGKTVETNHKASSLTSTKAVKLKPITNGDAEENEAPRPQVRL